MFCGSCGAQIKEGAKFCPHCGQAVLAGTPVQTELSGEDKKEMATESRCKYCGELLKEGALFCGNCGGKTEENAFSGSPPPEDKTAPPEPEEPEAHDEAAAPVEPEGEASPGVLNIPAQATDGGYLKTIAGKNSEIARFNAGLERLTAERNQISDENRKFKESFEKTKSGLIAAIIIGALGIIIAIAVGYNKWKAMDSLLWSAYLEGQSLLQVNITDLKIGNTDNAGNWLTSPGEALESAKMRYLMPVITLNSVISGNITLNCKIIDGRGIVIRNPSISPEGYSNTTTINVSRSGNQSFKLTGWGNNDQSTYGSGEWTVEVWWNDVCLKSAKIRIN